MRPPLFVFFLSEVRGALPFLLRLWRAAFAAMEGRVGSFGEPGRALGVRLALRQPSRPGWRRGGAGPGRDGEALDFAASREEQLGKIGDSGAPCCKKAMG